MNKERRKEVVLAMETIMRCVNDERQFKRWLINGVADGDINKFDVNEVDEFYIEDDTFRNLMIMFQRIITGEYRNDGLYCDNVLAVEERSQT